MCYSLVICIATNIKFRHTERDRETKRENLRKKKQIVSPPPVDSQLHGTQQVTSPEYSQFQTIVLKNKCKYILKGALYASFHLHTFTAEEPTR